MILKRIKETKSVLALKWGDLIVICLLVSVIGLLFAFTFFGKNESLTAEVTLGGETVLTIDLGLIDVGECYTVGNCEILFEKDGVTFFKSSCPDKLCIKNGKLKRKGDTMACVPERAVVNLRDKKQDDFHIFTY